MYQTLQMYNQLIEIIFISIFTVGLTKMKKHRLIFIMISILLNAIVCYLLSLYKIRDMSIVILIEMINCSLLYFCKEDFSLKDMGISFYVYILNLVSVYISLQLFSISLDKTPMKIVVYEDLLRLQQIIVFSKCIFVVLYFTSIKLSITNIFFNNNKEDLFVNCGLLLTIILFFTYIKSMFTSNYNPMTILDYIKNIVLLMLIFYMMIILFRRYKIYIEKKAEEMSKREKEKTFQLYKRDNLKNLKRIKMDIDQKEHRMNYILQSIEYDLKNENYSEAIQKIEIIKELISKIEPVIYTENEMFDFMINLEIKQLYNNHKRIKVGAFISKNDSYNEFYIWNKIIEFIRYISAYNDYFELFITEKNNHKVETKFIITSMISNDLEKGLMTIDGDIHVNRIDNIVTISYVDQLKQ